MSQEEFESAEFEPGSRYELIHGVLVVSPAPLEEERDSNDELGYLLRKYLESGQPGMGLDLTLPEQNLRTRTSNRRCDRAIWVGLGRMPRTRGPVRKRDVPAIVVESASSRPADLRRDYEEKRIEYRDLGVREYWVVDRFRRTLTVHHWKGKRWLRTVVGEQGVFETPLLPGFRLALSRLLAISDKYAGE